MKVTQLYTASKNNAIDFIKNEQGVTAIEYALIGVAMASLLAVVLGNQNDGFLGALKKTFETIEAAITSVTSQM